MLKSKRSQPSVGMKSACSTKAYHYMLFALVMKGEEGFDATMDPNNPEKMEHDALEHLIDYLEDDLGFEFIDPPYKKGSEHKSDREKIRETIRNYGMVYLEEQGLIYVDKHGSRYYKRLVLNVVNYSTHENDAANDKATSVNTVLLKVKNLKGKSEAKEEVANHSSEQRIRINKLASDILITNCELPGDSKNLIRLISSTLDKVPAPLMNQNLLLPGIKEV